jgi:hypothetical protein
VGYFISFLVGAWVAYWVIRYAVSGGMKDFEKWKRKQYGESGRHGEQP